MPDPFQNFVPVYLHSGGVGGLQLAVLLKNVQDGTALSHISPKPLSPSPIYFLVSQHFVFLQGERKVHVLKK